MSDNRYVRAPIKFAQLISHYTDVYFYQFSYHGKLGGNTHLIDGKSTQKFTELAINFYFIHAGIPKVGHGEDLNYFWSTRKTLDDFPDSDKKTVDRYVGLLTNFAKYL